MPQNQVKHCSKSEEINSIKLTQINGYKIILNQTKGRVHIDSRCQCLRKHNIPVLHFYAMPSAESAQRIYAQISTKRV